MEFKKLSAVETVESVSDTANVLIEEAGVIKRAPKDEIGGGIKVASTAEVGQTIVVKAVDAAGNPTEWECADMSGGEEPDMVITINGCSSQTITNDTFNITAGSMDNVFAAFHEGRYPRVKVRFHLYENDAYTAIREEYNASVCTYGEDLWIKLITVDPYSSENINCQSIYLHADGFASSEVRSANLTAVS